MSIMFDGTPDQLSDGSHLPMGRYDLLEAMRDSGGISTPEVAVFKAIAEKAEEAAALSAETIAEYQHAVEARRARIALVATGVINPSLYVGQAPQLPAQRV